MPELIIIACWLESTGGLAPPPTRAPELAMGDLFSRETEIESLSSSLSMLLGLLESLFDGSNRSLGLLRLNVNLLVVRFSLLGLLTIVTLIWGPTSSGLVVMVGVVFLLSGSDDLLAGGSGSDFDSFDVSKAAGCTAGFFFLIKEILI